MSFKYAFFKYAFFNDEENSLVATSSPYYYFCVCEKTILINWRILLDYGL